MNPRPTFTTGSFKRSTVVIERLGIVRTVQMEEAVLNEIERNPETSTRKIAHELNITRVTVWQILRHQQLYPYHFCNWLRNQILRNPNFLSQVSFTDEACFSRNAIINFHNNHVLSVDNPHAFIEHHFQEQFSFNIWAGNIGNHFIGPYFLPHRLIGEQYQRFLVHLLPELLEEVPLRKRCRMWYMHDGAPAHFSLVACQVLNENYPNCWMGRGGPQFWPPRSPDINPLDYFLWGYLNSLVYKTPVQNEEDLRNRIVDLCLIIKNTPHIFERVRHSMIRRLNRCIEAGSGHFQHLL
nr:unnamed protein product [Callosobruchus chinensis]